MRDRLSREEEFEKEKVDPNQKRIEIRKRTKGSYAVSEQKKLFNSDDLGELIPPLSLLSNQKVIFQECQKNLVIYFALIEKKLSGLRRGSQGSICTTRTSCNPYEIEPAVGVKGSQIVAFRFS